MMKQPAMIFATILSMDGHFELQLPQAFTEDNTLGGVGCDGCVEVAKGETKPRGLTHSIMSCPSLDLDLYCLQRLNIHQCPTAASTVIAKITKPVRHYCRNFTFFGSFFQPYCS